MNKIRTRVDISKSENRVAVEKLELLQRDEKIRRLVKILSGESKIRWKDSIKVVLAKENF